PRRYIQGAVTEDQRYLVIAAAESTSGNELYIQDLQDPNSKIIPVIKNFDSEHTVIYSQGSKLYIQTNLNAPNNRVVEVDINNLSAENWKDIIPEKEMVLSAATAGGKVFASYLEDAK